MKKTAFISGLFAAMIFPTGSFAAEPSFTKEEVQAAYALGRADAAREQLAASPAARSLAAKMKPAEQPKPAEPKEKKP